MVMTHKERENLRDLIAELLAERDLSELLEAFDVSPEDAFLALFESGHIDPEVFNEMTGYNY